VWRSASPVSSTAYARSRSCRASRPAASSWTRFALISSATAWPAACSETPARFAQQPVGPREHGPHIGGPVADGKPVQPVPGVAQTGGQRGERCGRTDHRPGRGDRQGQRQSRAQRYELGGLFAFGGDPGVAEPGGQQLPGLVCGQHVKRQRAGSLRGHQPRELVSAGHQHRTAGRARQQRPHLFLIACIVQNDEHSLASKQAAVQPCQRIGPLRDPGRRDAQRLQESADRLGGRDRCR